jgi:DNA-binding NarL/FixJ family response regulator
MFTEALDKISIMIVDDHPALRMGIRTILEKVSEFCVVGEAGDGEEARKLLAELYPRIVLLDLVMPDFSPAIFEKWVREHYPETITLVLTSHDRDAYLANMIDAGAAGYLKKEVNAEQLINSIKRAALGEKLFDQQQFARARHWHEDIENKWNSLSKRECQILYLLADGASNKDIASHLLISLKTVDKHLERIYQKLDVGCRAKAVVWGMKNRGDFPY